MATDRSDALSTYRAKRRFDQTPEPKGRLARKSGHLYTIQKHAATRLHYDLRLELGGVLKSWAVTKGPSLDPSDKRLAVRTEDHPVDYATFEGRIPEGNYGAGTVLLWDQGTWNPIGDPERGMKRGKLEFELAGERLSGRWTLVRMREKKRTRPGRRPPENWLLIKKKDEKIDRRADVTAKNTVSVASGREMGEIAADPGAEWTSSGKTESAPRRGRRKDAPLPAFVEPMLATLVDEVPSGDRWLFEIKFDGYRAIAAASGENVRINTRRGLDWTKRFASIARALGRLELPGVLLDGEIAVTDEIGRSDFGALQNALDNPDEGRGILSYFVFDLLVENGNSLTRVPLTERKERLRGLLGAAGRRGPVFFVDHIEHDGAKMLDTLCKKGFEGAIAKRADAPYRSGRSRSWLKIKCGNQQEFVIVGWSPSSRNRPFSSILLGVREAGGLRYVGRVGAGFSRRDLETLAARFQPTKRKPVTGDVPREAARKAHWVKPELVAEIAFAGFTREGLVRQGRFVGLREDKSAQEVARETAKPVEEIERMATTKDSASFGGVRLTHPDKILFPEQGVSKRDLAHYFEACAERMLPHLADRLVSLVRCPEGHERECFFQRHAGASLPDQFLRHQVAEKGGKKREYISIDGAQGLFAAAQMGVLEIHLWGSRIDDVERPDRIVFDLDPDPSVDFSAVKHAAERVRDALDALELASFALLTGGKGIHVVVPIVRRYEWPVVKGFAQGLAERFADDAPDKYVATMSKTKRKGRIFIDYFRNDRTATAIAPYSPRARAGAPIAAPIAWAELDEVTAANHITVETAPQRLAGDDPWAGYGETRQSLKVAALRALGVDV